MNLPIVKQLPILKKLIVLLFVTGLAVAARAELVIEITRGSDNPTVIGIVPFNTLGQSASPEELHKIIANNLTSSGQFRTINPASMLSFPTNRAEVIYRDWRMLGSEFLVIGNIETLTDGFRVTYSLYDVVSEREVIAPEIIKRPKNQIRDVAHYISDRIYEAITGVRGVFSTRLLYVEAEENLSQYRLILSDIDGARARVLFKSREPILSPAWSPTGSHIAYVSFETGRPAIFIQELATGSRQQITNFTGLNGAPSWSSDGKKLALVLSKEGNPEIYILDLALRKLKRITYTLAIDTEPVWSTDDKKIFFTSNRGGMPQIYQVTLENGLVERLTFEGSYNARPRVTPDGKGLVMVHLFEDMFHIAIQDLAMGDVRILTQTDLDESPTIAPNGAMLMYATKLNEKGILAAIALDTGMKYNLPSRSGNVREPAWSPYFN